MQEFEFTLKFSLPDTATYTQTDPDIFISKLAESCDDALIGIGKKGRIALQFTREADTALDAVYTAIQNVKKAIPGAKLIEATPDLVGITDIAECLDFTRQNIRKLALNNSNFPAPVHEGKTAFWHLASVLDWFKTSGRYEVDLSLLEIAKANMQFNIAKEISTMDTSSQTKLLAVFAE